MKSLYRFNAFQNSWASIPVNGPTYSSHEVTRDLMRLSRLGLDMHWGTLTAQMRDGNRRAHARTFFLAFILAASLAPVSDGSSDTVHREFDVTVYHDSAFGAEQNPRAIVDRRLEFLAQVFEPLDLTFRLAGVHQGPDVEPCGGTGSALDWLAAQPRMSDIKIYLTGAEPPPSGVLGCAAQDGIAHAAPYAAMYDPPYRGVTMGGTPAQREHHANLLFAHEIGHVLGGLHQLAAPNDPSFPTGGTLMSPVLQYNAPFLTGLLEPQSGYCLQHGNACRIREVAVSDAQSSTRMMRDSIIEDAPRAASITA